MTSKIGPLAHAEPVGFSGATSRARCDLPRFFLMFDPLRCMCSSTMSTHSRLSLVRINLCRRATNICLTRRWRPCGPRQTTATVVGTWPRFSQFERTAHAALRCMVPRRRTSETRRSNGRDAWCAFTLRFCFEHAYPGPFEGEYAVFRIGRIGVVVTDFTVFVAGHVMWQDFGESIAAAIPRIIRLLCNSSRFPVTTRAIPEPRAHLTPTAF